MTFLAQILQQLGYVGATGSTPYRASSALQIAALQSQYNSALNGQTITRSSAIQLTLNFDGTQNNRDYVDLENGESPTNVASLLDRQRQGGNPDNSFYYPGIGAQTVPTGTLLPNGNPDPRSSPSNLQSTPWRAGEIGNEIINQAYDDLKNRVTAILAADPTAQISLNLTGFSRGGAEAVAFANLVNERGIPGLYPAGQVPINSMVLYDPVSQTTGLLNVNWPTNLVNPALVFVATADNRSAFAAMPVGANSILIPIDGAHSDTGGSFNPDGISAVTLRIAHDYLAAAGVPLAEIPAGLQPNWDRMYIHNSAIDNFGNIQWSAFNGDPFSSADGYRYYEGTGLGGVSVRDVLGRDIQITPIYENVNGRFTLAGFSGSSNATSVDPDTGATTQTRDTTLYARDGQTVTGRNFTSTTTDSTGQLSDRLIVTYAQDGTTIRATSLTERLPNNNLLTTNRDGAGNTTNTVEQQRFDDGSAFATTTYPSGRTEVVATDTTGRPASLLITTPTGNNTETIESYSYNSAGQRTLRSSTQVETFYDESDTGTSRIELVTTYPGGVPSTVRNVYNNDNTLFSTTPLPSSGISNLAASEAANAVNDLLQFGQLAASGTRPAAYVFASGLTLLNRNFNPTDNQGIQRYPNFGTAATVAQGALSLYNLGQAFSGSGSDLARFSATGNAINFVNQNLISGGGNAALNNALSGGQGGLLGGSPGILPAIGLISAIKAKDPIGIAQGAIGLFNPALLFTSGVGFTPLGWFFIGVSILKIVFADAPPKAWGVANVSYGAGFDNLLLQVNASGESFGKDKARQTLQGIATFMQERVDTINVHQAAGQQVGLIAQRMPSLTWRASEFGDKGFSIVDIDPLTGEQKYPYRRFDDQGVPFSSNPALYQVDLSDPEQRGGLNDALLRAASRRGAIAPLWEVQTAKLQGDAGVPDAGLSEEERAAKHGLGAALDTAYAAAHAGDPAAKHKRIGSFMAVGLDLDGSGTISTQTMAGNAASAGTITFNWDNQGYQKEVGSIDANDGYLVLDRDFNQSVDNGTELLSNPLVADPAKGLRSLAGWDTQMDHLSAMHSIAVYAIFHWAEGVNSYQSRAVNDDVWRKAA